MNQDTGQLSKLDVGESVAPEGEGAAVADDDGARAAGDARQVGGARTRRRRRRCRRGRRRRRRRSASGDRRVVRVDPEVHGVLGQGLRRGE